MFDSNGMLESGQNIVVTARRRTENLMAAPMAMMSADGAAEAEMMMAGEEDLGDLKLYRVPENVTVAAQSLKQVAFLDRSSVEGRLLYMADCAPYSWSGEPRAAQIVLETVNDEEHGLGVALPTGSLSVFERSPSGELLIAEDNLRDYASGQDVELALGTSNQVFSKCELMGEEATARRWAGMRATLTNANPHALTLRLRVGSPTQWRIDNIRTRLKDGQRIAEITIPANGERVLDWRVKPALAD